MRAFYEKGKLHLVTREYVKGLWIEIPQEELVFDKRMTKAIEKAVTDKIIEDMEINWHDTSQGHISVR